MFRNVESYSMETDADTSGKNKANEQKSSFRRKWNLIQNNNKRQRKYSNSPTYERVPFRERVRKSTLVLSQQS